MELTTVLFDLDGTICEPVTPPQDRLAALFERAGVEPFFDVADIHRLAAEIDADSAPEFHRSLYRSAARENGMAMGVVEDLVAAYEAPDPTEIRFRSGVEKVLETIAKRYQVGLVTNGGREIQQTKLETLDIANTFDATVFAKPGRAVKPATEPFERALSALSVSPPAAVHVGDSLYADVAGAHAAGVYSVWVPWNDAQPQPTDESDTFDGIEPPTMAIETMIQLPSVLDQQL